MHDNVAGRLAKDDVVCTLILVDLNADIVLKGANRGLGVELRWNVFLERVK